jgi:LytS/YehU family sensor histidine kinase
VPALILQPLVENAYRHGFARRRRDAQVSIRARVEERVRLEVHDNGGGMPADWTEGIGIGNTRARLAQLYGSDQLLTVENAPGGGVRATIELPRRPA